MATYGLDLSSHNGGLDFAAIKSAGHDFVILRAGYGWSTDQKDSRFEEYYKAAKAAGLKVGAYWYSYARNESEAQAEADTFLEVIKGKQFEMPVYIDMEDADGWKAANGNPSGYDQAQIANTFMELVEAAGYYTGIYASSSWLNGYLDGLSHSYTQWEANWGTNDGQNHGGVSNPIHQFTSEYVLNGKRFDRNVCTADFEAVIKANGLNGYSGSAETASSSPSRSKAYESMKNEVLGMSYDIDGYYGPQCWDFAVKIFRDYYGGKVIHCSQSGYVKDIANQRATNGILDFCDDVGLSAILEPGDVCVWGNCAACPDSHIAIFDHDDGQNQCYFLGQNQGASYVNIKKIDVSGVIGVFRPKAILNYSEDAATPTRECEINGLSCIAERGAATFNKAVNIRIGDPTGDVKGKTKNGQTIEYFAKYIGHGHRYVITTIEKQLCFIAVSGSETQGVDKWTSKIETK